MKFRVIIQSRTSSVRLPGKALMPLAGLPTAVLCALRARNRGADVVLATSTDPTDDRLAGVAKDAGLHVFRGPLDDVLARYFHAANDLPPGAVVVRLTADNPFPDGAFVETLVKNLYERGLEYMGTCSPLDGLPYGLSAEAFTVKALREAQKAASTAFDREHVTPWIIREKGRALYEPPGSPHHLAHLRCTMDDLSDYQRLSKVFDKVADPVELPWAELCVILQGLRGEPSWRVPFRVRGGEAHSELTLGTAQLGMEYGIVNALGKPSFKEARAMVRSAVAHGAGSFDTAREYQEAEKTLGKIIKEEFPGRCTVVTKLGLLKSLPFNAAAPTVADAVDASVLASCLNLARKPLDYLLLHDWSHRGAFGGVVWKRLLELKREGAIARLGASVYEPGEALEALNDPDVALIQIPFNILDRRWKDSGFTEKAKKRSAVVIHARSVLLQGLLAAPPKAWSATGVKDAGAWAKKVGALAKALERKSVLDLCIAYVRAQPWLTSLVLGMESEKQLEENMRLFLEPALTAAECGRCERELSGAPEKLLNPGLWGPAAAREPRHGQKSTAA
ncbi:MAG: aldo/keto reductase [Elusimicrobia bacterium]|nr:aldo/keto reductase [Elusimicrobiota bacterium]